MLVSLKEAQGKPTPLFYGVVILLLFLNIIPVLGFFPQLIYFTVGSGTPSSFIYLAGPFVAMANIPILGYLLFRQVPMSMKIVYGSIIAASIIYLIYVALTRL
jgi:hypothetical protein